MIFGATGSGKTTGSGAKVARGFLRSGFGGLVLCVKKDEPALWQQYAQQVGRADDIRMFGAREGDGFNFLEYEQRRRGDGAGHTENLVQLFVQVTEIVSQKRRSSEPYFELAMKQLLRNTIDLITLGGERVDLGTIAAVIQSAPQTPEEAVSSQWLKSALCARLLARADDNTQADQRRRPDYEITANYWLGELPRLDHRTKSNVISTFTTLADALLRGKMRQLFCAATTLTPDDLLDGKIIVVALPVKEYAELGQFAGVIWKFLAQKALERQERPTRPVFIWADEAHHFTTSHDQLFQTTARSARAATVYLAQNYPNFLAALGGEQAAKARVDSLLGNLQTKIFHQNSDPETNDLAAKTISKFLHYRRSETNGVESNSSTMQPTVDFEVQPQAFTMLKKGGTQNRCVVDAIIHQGGRQWSSGRTWIRTTFNQKKHE
jgi:hypothetical protein